MLPRGWHINQAVRALHAEGVIAYPTEAVWGVGCDPFSESAFKRLLQLKQRPSDKGVILIGGCADHFSFLLDPLDDQAKSKILTATQTPTTWLVPDPEHRVPEWIRGKYTQVAIRVSDHLLVRSLCDKFGGPIVSTSANPAGKPPARSALRIRQYFSNELDYILPGALGGHARPSRIIDLQTGRILRA
ncbi:MAG: Sua5/YciO/YrdC/YwlC family protein [Hahellaceae bacterium]|nr:Sua5/YciO/YrdC/YwlC family protein [Hahellaceae bacterium]